MKIPDELIEKFEKASTGLFYGNVILTLSLKQGKARYVLAREESFIPGEQSKSPEPNIQDKEVVEM